MALQLQVRTSRRSGATLLGTVAVPNAETHLNDVRQLVGDGLGTSLDAIVSATGGFRFVVAGKLLRPSAEPTTTLSEAMPQLPLGGAALPSPAFAFAPPVPDASPSGAMLVVFVAREPKPRPAIDKSRRSALRVKRHSDATPLTTTVTLSVRTPSAVGAARIASLTVRLDATLETVRQQLVADAAKQLKPAASTQPPPRDDGNTNKAHASVPPAYPLDLTKSFRFVLRGGHRTIRPSAEPNTRVVDLLPPLPFYGAPTEARFRFDPDADTIVRSVTRKQQPQQQRRRRRRDDPTPAATVLSEACCVLFVAGETADGMPRGIDAPLAARLAMQHVAGANRLPTPKQLATCVTRTTANLPDLTGRTVLHESALDGNVAAVAYLAGLSYVDVDRRDARGDTALHICTRHGHLDVVAALVDAGASIINQNHRGETPLHVALYKRLDTVVDLMCRRLRHDAVGAASLSGLKDVCGHTPLSLFAFLSPSVDQLCADGNLPALSALHRHYLHDRRGASPHGPAATLHAAASSGNVDVVSFAVEELVSPALLRDDAALLLDSAGRTPLHIAASLGHADVVRCLVQHRMDASTQDVAGRTALHWALYMGAWDVAALLVQLPGAPSTFATMDGVGATPLHLAAGAGQSHILSTMLRAVPSAADARADLSRTVELQPVPARSVPDARTQRHDYARFQLTVRARYGCRRRAARHVARARESVATVVRGPSPLWSAVHATNGSAAANARMAATVAVLLGHGAGRSSYDTPAALLDLVGHALRAGCTDVAGTLLKLAGSDAAHETQLLRECCADGTLPLVQWLVERGVGCTPLNDALDVESPFAAACARGHTRIVEYLLTTNAVAPDPAALGIAAQANHTSVVKLLMRARIRVPTGTDGLPSPVALAATRGFDELLGSILGCGGNPNAVDEDGLPALWCALHAAPTPMRVATRAATGGALRAALRTAAETAAHSRCAVALIRAGAATVASGGVHHVLEMATLAAAKGMSDVVNALLDEVLVLPASERQAVIASAPEAPARAVEERQPPLVHAKNASMRRLLPQQKPYRRFVIAPFDPRVPVHRRHARDIFSYAAAVRDLDLLRRLALEVKLPAADAAPGDVFGRSACDYALESGCGESAVLLCALGVLPHRAHKVASVSLQRLQAAAHAARRAVAVANVPAPHVPAAQRDALIVELLRAGEDATAVALLRAAWARAASANEAEQWLAGHVLRSALQHRRIAVVRHVFGAVRASALEPAPLVAICLDVGAPDLAALLLQHRPPTSNDCGTAVLAKAPAKRWTQRVRKSIVFGAVDTPLLTLAAAAGDAALVAALAGAGACYATPAGDAVLAAIAGCPRNAAAHRVDVAARICTLLLAAGVRPSSMSTVLRAAVQRRFFGLVSELLTVAMQDVPSSDLVRATSPRELSLLHYAAAAGETSLVLRILLAVPDAASAAPPRPAADDRHAVRLPSPIDLALRNGAPQTAAVLFAHGFAPSATLSIPCNGLSTYAARIGAVRDRLAAARLHPRMSKARATGTDTAAAAAGRVSGVLTDAMRVCYAMLRLHRATATWGDGWTVLTLAAASGSTEVLATFDAIATDSALTCGRVTDYVTATRAQGAASVGLLALAAGRLPQALQLLERDALLCGPLAAPAAALIAVASGSDAALTAVIAAGAPVNDAPVAIVDESAGGVVPGGCKGTLGHCGPAAAALRALLRPYIDVGRNKKWRAIALTPIAAAVALGDAAAVRTLVANGANPRCSASLFAPVAALRRKQDATPIAASPLILAVDAVARARGAAYARAVEMLRVLIAAGAMEAADASYVVQLLLQRDDTETAAIAITAAAQAAARADPQLPADQARRCLRATTDARVPVMLRGHLSTLRHPLQAAAASAKAEKDFVVLVARHSQRADVEASRDARGRSIMFHATRTGSRAALDVMLGVGLAHDTPCDDATGATPLMVAARYGRLVHASKLLAAYRDGASVDAVDRFGNTALMHACARGHKEVAELLLGVGASVRPVNSAGLNAVLLAIGARAEDVALALIQHWCDTTSLRSDTTTAFHAAAMSGSVAVTRHLLTMPAADAPTLVKEADARTGHSALYLAWAFGRTAVMRLILAHVAELGLQDDGSHDDVKPVLACTASRDCPGWMRHMLQLNAEVNRRMGTVAPGDAHHFAGSSVLRPGELVDAPVTTPFRTTRPPPARPRKGTKAARSTLSRQLPPAANLLIWCARTGCAVGIRTLSEHNVIDDCCALHEAAARGHVDACRMLVSLRMSDITAVNDKGESALHVALRYCRVDAARVLAELWPLPSHVDPLVATGFGGGNVFHAAARHPTVLAVLLKNIESVAGLIGPAAAAASTTTTSSDARDIADGAHSTHAATLRSALLAADEAGFTPFEHALMFGSAACALQLATTLSAGSAAVALPVARSKLAELPSLAPSVRALLFDVFRIAEVASSAGFVPPPQDGGASAEWTAATARLPLPDVRALGLAHLAASSDRELARRVAAAASEDHERTYAFRELIQALQLPLRVNFMFDSIAHVAEAERLFIVRRLVSSGLLGRYRHALADLPAGTIRSVKLEYVSDPRSVTVVVGEGEVHERFTVQRDASVIVTASLDDAVERAYGVSAQSTRRGIDAAARKAQESARVLLAAHPVLKHLRISADVGNALTRSPPHAHYDIGCSVAAACVDTVDAIATVVGDTLASVTAEELAKVASSAPQAPHIVIKWAELADATTRVSPDDGLVTLVAESSGLRAAEAVSALQAPIGRVARHDAALIQAHVLRDVFVSRTLPTAMYGTMDAAAAARSGAVKFKLDREGADIGDMPPTVLAATLANAARAVHIVATMGRHARPESATARIAGSVVNGINTVAVLFSTRRVPAARRNGPKLLLNFDTHAAPHTEDIVRALRVDTASLELDKLKEALPALANDASQRLHTYLPHAAFNIDTGSLATAYPDPEDQLAALGVLMHDRGSAVLQRIVQAVSLGWDTRLGGVIRRHVRTVHVAVTSTRPSVVDLLPGGHLVYSANLLTRWCANGALDPMATRTTVGAGLLSAQELASTVVILVHEAEGAGGTMAQLVEQGTAFACWSRLVPGALRVVAGTQQKFIIQARNVFNRPCVSDLGAKEPFDVTLWQGDVAETIEVATKKAVDGTLRYRGTFSAPARAAAFTLHATLHGQALQRSPVRITVANGPLDVTKTAVTMPFDTLVVGRPATLKLHARDAHGNALRGALGATVRVDGPAEADVTITSFEDGGDGTISVTVTASRATNKATIMMRVVDLRKARGPAPPALACDVEVLTEAQYSDWLAWRCGISKAETDKRRRERACLFFRQTMRDNEQKRREADAAALGPVARARRLPAEYPRTYNALIAEGDGTKKPPKRAALKKATQVKRA